MIVKKKWRKRNVLRSDYGTYMYTGWFLFGIIPLYIGREGVR